MNHDLRLPHLLAKPATFEAKAGDSLAVEGFLPGGQFFAGEHVPCQGILPGDRTPADTDDYGSLARNTPGQGSR